MTEEEDFVVQEPYQPTDEEKKAIKELEAKGLTSDDWDSGKSQIKSFKENLREDMYEKQNELCVYCRCIASTSCIRSPIRNGFSCQKTYAYLAIGVTFTKAQQKYW